jgi:hypothetical protein
MTQGKETASDLRFQGTQGRTTTASPIPEIPTTRRTEMPTVTDPKTLTLTQTAPGVICDQTECGTAVLIEPGTYAIDSIDRDEQLAYLDVPAVEDWYVAVHTDWLDAEAVPIPARPKGR